MKILLQFAVIFALCLAGEGIAALLPFAFPASAVAMTLLFFCFLFRILKTEAIESSARFLLENMSLFFIPAGVGILNCIDQIKNAVMPLLLICVLSTFVTFAAAAYAVRLTVWILKKYRERRAFHE